VSKNLIPTAVTLSRLQPMHFLGICDHHFVANPWSSLLFTVVSQPNFTWLVCLFPYYWRLGLILGPRFYNIARGCMFSSVTSGRDHIPTGLAQIAIHIYTSLMAYNKELRSYLSVYKQPNFSIAEALVRFRVRPLVIYCRQSCTELQVFSTYFGLLLSVLSLQHCCIFIFHSSITDAN
jgi:hypothetical protein